MPAGGRCLLAVASPAPRPRRGRDGGTDVSDEHRRDAALVELVRSGDKHAFEELYVRHHATVARVVGAILHDRDQANDVVQETFTRSLHRLGTLRDPERFAPWLFSIARHVATDHLRHRLRVQIASDDGELDAAAIEPGPEELAELAELSRLVSAGMTRLAPRDATAVALVTHLGFTPAELAIALGVSHGAAKVIVHRARRRLRDALFLELLGRSHDAGCADRPPFDDTDDESCARVLRHVLGCRACTDALTSDVRGYEFPTGPASLSPAPAG